MQRTELKNIMRQDRENGDVFSESRAEYYQRLQDMKPSNGPVLEHSPCIRVKKTGVIWPWTEEFAARPDLCECCNEDGSAWTGAPVEPAVEPPVVNGVIDRKPVRNEHTSAVGMASETLGVDKEFSTDFSVNSNSKEALPLPEQKSSLEIGSILDAVFANNVK